MATVGELRESIEQRLRQLLDEAGRLQRALDALAPGGSDARARRDTSPAAARANPKPPSPPAARRNERGARAAGVAPNRAQDQPDAAERALRALRAELGAGLRTTGGA
jgi:hypothetical protein